jgi:nucleotide-binding universal stress UspA family protein
MIETVAVGTDGSETAAQAVDMAADIAERFGAKVVVLSALQQGNAPINPDERQWATNPDSLLREIVGRTERSLSSRGIECESLLRDGDPADVLVELAEECQADVLVIGNKGMKRRILGSVPNSVTHKAPCAVLVVKTT